MQFPNSPDQAFELFAKLMLCDLGLLDTPNKQVVNLPAAWLKALVLGPSLAELTKKGQTRNRAGFTAGILLWSAFLYSQQPSKRITLNTAIELVMRAEEGRSDFQVHGVDLYPNKPEIHRAWKAMRNAAHLWAGLVIVEVEAANGRLKPSPEALQLAMGIAKSLGEWGCACEVASADGGRGTLLDPSTLLRLPDFVPPIPLEPVPVALPEYVTRPIGKR
jgi:hypothetical protein